MPKLFDLYKPLPNPSNNRDQDKMLELFAMIYSSEGSTLSV